MRTDASDRAVDDTAFAPDALVHCARDTNLETGDAASGAVPVRRLVDEVKMVGLNRAVDDLCLFSSNRCLQTRRARDDVPLMPSRS